MFRPELLKFVRGRAVLHYFTYLRANLLAIRLVELAREKLPEAILDIRNLNAEQFAEKYRA